MKINQFFLFSSPSLTSVFINSHRIWYLPRKQWNLLLCERDSWDKWAQRKAEQTSSSDSFSLAESQSHMQLAHFPPTSSQGLCLLLNPFFRFSFLSHNAWFFEDCRPAAFLNFTKRSFVLIPRCPLPSHLSWPARQMSGGIARPQTKPTHGLSCALSGVPIPMMAAQRHALKSRGRLKKLANLLRRERKSEGESEKALSGEQPNEKGWGLQETVRDRGWKYTSDERPRKRCGKIQHFEQVLGIKIGASIQFLLVICQVRLSQVFWCLGWSFHGEKLLLRIEDDSATFVWWKSIVRFLFRLAQLTFPSYKFLQFFLLASETWWREIGLRSIFSLKTFSLFHIQFFLRRRSRKFLKLFVEWTKNWWHHESRVFPPAVDFSGESWSGENPNFYSSSRSRWENGNKDSQNRKSVWNCRKRRSFYLKTKRSFEWNLRWKRQESNLKSDIFFDR